MRVTIVQGAFLPVPPLLGGAVEKVWFNLGKEFAKRGHEVTHVSRSYESLPRREQIDGVRHIRVSGFASPGSFSRRLLLDFWYALRVLQKLPPADIVVTNTFWLPVLMKRRARGVPYVHVARYPKGQMKLYRGAVLQTVSEAIRTAILAEDPSAAERVRVIPYPLAARYLLPSVPSGENVVLYTGRVHPEKGIHLLLEAFARSTTLTKDQWRLEIVGPWEVAYGGGGDAYLAELRRLAEPIRGRVEFVGRIFDEERLIAHYARAKAFVYPSLAEKGETFGLAALEAMAAGCAPIVSGLECFQDFIESGKNGLVFDHRGTDPAGALVARLDQLLTTGDLLDTLRRNAWSTARNYTMDRVVQLFLDDFASVTASARLPKHGSPVQTSAKS